MLQMFDIAFDPGQISSTNGIGISIGQCYIDLTTEQWYSAESDEDGYYITNILF